MSDYSQLGICQRIAKVRAEVAGPRGKSSFAKQLGISASTYDYYESRRVPPADILVRIADLSGVDLRWLLTGEAPGASAVPAAHPILRRAADLLAQCPDSAGPLGAFLDILSQTLKFPAKNAPAPLPAGGSADEGPDIRLPQPLDAETAQRIRSTSDESRDSWIPILGRSAAGVAQFWTGDDEASGVRTLAQLVARHAGRHAARAEPAGLTTLPATLESPAEVPERGAQGVLSQRPPSPDAQPLRDLPVQIITLEGPDESNVAEYVASAPMKARRPDAFAVRIDGESMSPEIRHGDIVLLSPSSPAADGRPAVVQLRRQIGVTCKLFRRQAGRVHLVPVNEHFPPQSFPADNVVWALRVLATIRPAGRLGDLVHLK